MMKHNPYRVELVFTLPQVGAVIESPPQLGLFILNAFGVEAIIKRHMQ